MTVEEIIDQALAQGDNVSPTSADYLERRRLALSFLREVLDDVWWTRDWPWKRRNDFAIFVPAGQGYVNLPYDFNSLGVFGAVFTPEGKPLEEVPESVIADFNAVEQYSQSDANLFAIHTQDEETYLPRIHIPRNAVRQELRLYYQTDPPHLLDLGDTDGYGTVTVTTLTYDETTGIVTATNAYRAANQGHGFETGDRVLIAVGGPSIFTGSWVITVTGEYTFTYDTGIIGGPVAPDTGTATYDVPYANRAILRVPSKYHGCVFMWGVRAMLRESKGDQRWAYAHEQYQGGLKNILGEEAREKSRRNGLAQMPSFFGNRRGYH